MSDTDTESRTPQEKWEEHNESFQYDAPDRPADAWSSEEYTELYDRLIGKRVQWPCQKCSKPFSSLQKARRHVEKQHGSQLLDKYAPDPEPVTDGGTEEDEGTDWDKRESENHGLGDFDA
jgi:hypothetical protein